MPPLRICFFNRSYWPDHGATGQLLTELAESLVGEYGCKISVVVGPPLSNGKAAAVLAQSWMPVRREWRNRVEIFRAASTVFKPQRFTGRATNYLSYFLSACLAGLWAPRSDVVVSLTDPPIIGLAALLMARRTGARFVFLCQDVFPEVAWLLDDFHSAQLNRLLDRINRLLIREADQVVSLGETMRERLIAGKGADPQKVKVIHNWADCSAIVPGPKHNPFSVAHGLAEAFVVMHSGNMGLSQSLETLVDVADRLRSYPDIVIAMVGDGAKREALEARARSQRLTNIRFFPYQPKESLRDSFASADIFVVSLKRGLAGYIVPSKLYGILAAGRPYVAAVEESCEVAAITRQYDCGLLVEPGDAKALADKILTLYHNRALAQRLGAKSDHMTLVHLNRAHPRQTGSRGTRLCQSCVDRFSARQAALAFDRPLQLRVYYNLFHELLPGSQFRP